MNIYLHTYYFDLKSNHHLRSNGGVYGLSLWTVLFSLTNVILFYGLTQSELSVIGVWMESKLNKTEALTFFGFWSLCKPTFLQTSTIFFHRNPWNTHVKALNYFFVVIALISFIFWTGKLSKRLSLMIKAKPKRCRGKVIYLENLPEPIVT